MSAIECENLVKIYQTKDLEVIALQGLDLRINKSEMLAIIGNSGSGKSTLLNLIGGLDKPSAGKLFVAGQDLNRLSSKELIYYQRFTVGFVWQNPARNLIPYLTARENIEIPLLLSGKKNKNRVNELMELLGISHRSNNKLKELSGGEQQRVAIAIALVNQPQIILADEPTGALDSATTLEIINLFKRVNRELGTTIIIVTHDLMLSKQVDRIIAIRDGKTSSEFIKKQVYHQEYQKLEAENDSHIEVAVLDQAGRLQLPEEYLLKTGFKKLGKVKIELDEKEKRLILIGYDSTKGLKNPVSSKRKKTK